MAFVLFLLNLEINLHSGLGCVFFKKKKCSRCIGGFIKVCLLRLSCSTFCFRLCVDMCPWLR